MKLSQVDFRPTKRSRHVPIPKWRIPIIRIVFLFGFAGLVYFKFEKIWHFLAASKISLLSANHTLAYKKKQESSVPNQSLPNWLYSSDSSHALLDCKRVETKACEQAMETIKPGLSGETNTFLEKIRFRKPGHRQLSLSSIEMAFPKQSTGDYVPVLVVLQARDGKDLLKFSRKIGTPIWLDANRREWTEIHPQYPMPFPTGMSNSDSSTSALTWFGTSEKIFPILPGRVTQFDSSEKGINLTIYHGRELYSYYEGMQSRGEDIRVGTRVHTDQTLGMGMPDSAGYHFRLRLRNAGMTFDPRAFFALNLVPNGS